MVAPGITGRTRPTKLKKQAAQQKRKRDDVDVEKLEQAVTELVGECVACTGLLLINAGPQEWLI